MTPTLLLSPEGLVSLARFIVPETLFAFDLDGTLAPIVDVPSAAAVEAPMREVLQRMIKAGKVCVISGRDRKEVLRLLGVEPQLVVGNHGAQFPFRDGGRNYDFVQQALKWREQLYEPLSHLPGVEIEFKGESVSVHYRRAEDQKAALAAIDAAVAQLTPPARRVGGKSVVNLVPELALDKGKALLAAMEILGASQAVYFGDDETDEDVFRLHEKQILGVHIGKEPTAASHYLLQQSDLSGLLVSIADILEQHLEQA